MQKKPKFYAAYTIVFITRMHAVTQKPSAYAVITVFIQMIVTKRNANPSAADVQNKTVPGAVLFSLFLMRCYGYGHVS